MSKARPLASRLLCAIVRHAPAECRDWAKAMLCELDFVEGDWPALLWALGSATTIFGQANRLSWTRLNQYFRREEKPVVKNIGKNIGKKITGTASGILLAAALALCAWGLYALSVYLFPSLEMGRVPWAAWLTVIVLPEAIFVVCAAKLWRNRRSTAFGILLSATVLVTHFAIHIANHWNQ